MIYTGYFAKTKYYTTSGLTTVSIAGKAPDFYKGVQYKKLAPSFGLVYAYKSGAIKPDEFRDIYYTEVLSKLDPVEVKKELEEITGAIDIVLLCYETPSDFCHRQLVSEWFNKAGIKVWESN